MKALDQYTTGLANSTYSTAYNQYLADSAQKYGQLFNVAQLGENATASTGAQGATAANAAGNYITQAGQANAAGALGTGAAVNSGLGSLGTLAYGGYLANQGTSGYGGNSTTGTGVAPVGGSGFDSFNSEGEI